MAAGYQRLAQHRYQAVVMSRSRKLQLHIAQMGEIRTILNSMKNLAFIETHKLSRFQIMQGQAVANIENAALDFLKFYPCLPKTDDNATRICILMGSERGFCGDFNERLIDAVATDAYSGIITIGSRLNSRLRSNLPAVIAKLAGANVAEEVPAILNQLIDNINSLQQSYPALMVKVIYHESNQISQKQVIPPFLLSKQGKLPYGYPPILNLEPTVFVSELIDHYLFAVLHEIFYLSLMAENQRRQQHLEGAVQHLDSEMLNLNRKSQNYRQEEITEEIEVILLNAENL
jgi:F-type H+-transporting ATPase subunit gamma